VPEKDNYLETLKVIKERGITEKGTNLRKNAEFKQDEKTHKGKLRKWEQQANKIKLKIDNKAELMTDVFVYFMSGVVKTLIKRPLILNKPIPKIITIY